jgi:hypothetical protein
VSRLVDLLSHVSGRELVPRGERLVLLVDGLDEYDAPAFPSRATTCSFKGWPAAGHGVASVIRCAAR